MCHYSDASSWAAKDVLSFDNQNFCGLLGYFCNRAANAGLYHADVIVAIGCRLDPLQMGYQPDDFFKSKKILAVDNDQAELAKQPLDEDDKFLISSDVFVNSMTEVFKENKLNYPNWTKIMRDAFLSSYDEMVNSKSGPFIDPYYLVDSISELKPDTYVAGSSGGSAEISFLNFRVSENQTFLNSPGLGSMGFAIPSIIGALEGEKQASVICVVGDGGLQMNIQELATISRYRARKVLIVVLNNNGYDSMRRSLRRYFGEAHFVDQETGLFFPSLKKLSDTYEFDYFKLESNREVEEQLENIWKNVLGPSILEVMINHDVESFPKLFPRMNKDGSISSGSFLDCHPEKSEWYDRLSLKIQAG